MKKYIFSLMVATIAIVQINAQRIAIVDIGGVLNELTTYQEAQTEIDKVASAWRQEISQEQDKIKSLYNKYQAEQVLLSDDARKNAEDAIVEKEGQLRDLQKRRFGPEGDLFKKRQQLVSPIQEQVFAAIESYAADRGFDIIFDKSGSAGLLFVGEEYDKTEDIKSRLK